MHFWCTVFSTYDRFLSGHKPTKSRSICNAHYWGVESRERKRREVSLNSLLSKEIPKQQILQFNGNLQMVFRKRKWMSSALFWVKTLRTLVCVQLLISYVDSTEAVFLKWVWIYKPSIFGFGINGFFFIIIKKKQIYSFLFFTLKS